MFRRMSIAARLVLVACLFLAPFGHGVWVELSGFARDIDQARLEQDGAAYLTGVDALRAAAARAAAQGQAGPDGKTVAETLARLRARHGAVIDADAALREAEAAAAGGDPRAALRRLAVAVNASSGILADPEVAGFSLGDLFALRLPDLRDQLVDGLRSAADPRPAARAVIRGRIETIRQSINDDVAAAVGPRGVAVLKPTLDAARLPMDDLVDRLLPMLDSGAVDPVVFRAALDAVDRFAAVSVAAFNDLLSARIARVEQERLRVFLISAAMSGLALVLAVWLVRAGILAPLRRMTDALLRLADGDVDAEVPRPRFDDEIAALSAAMQRFKQQLAASKTLSETVVRSTLHVSVATEQAASAIAQVSGGAHDESASVRRLRLSFDSAQAALEQVETLTADGQERAQVAATQLSESLADINAMADSVRAIADISREINSITLSIGKLASHSNILSLNASIEASRAGEQGRGFAVVARSVGALAQQTLSLAREITELAQRSSDQIGRGLEVATTVGRRMQDVSDSIREIDNLSQSIVGEVTRQRGEFGGVEAALVDLLQISQSNATAAEEITATMRSLSALTDDTRRQAERVMNGRGRRRRAVLIDAMLEADGRVEPVALYDLSEEGAMLTGEGPCAPGTRATLVFAAEGIRLPVETDACDHGFHYLRFTDRQLPTATVDAMAVAGIERLIDTTKNDHRAFVARIADAMAGRNRLTAAELSDHHTCRLGRWYDSVTDEVLLSLPAFPDLLEPHRRVHDKGRAVLAALEEGRTVDARAAMGELEALSREILDRLDRLGAEFHRRAVG
jgi:methyl-accepting chemotaxis protein